MCEWVGSDKVYTFHSGNEKVSEIAERVQLTFFFNMYLKCNIIFRRSTDNERLTREIENC